MFTLALLLIGLALLAAQVLTASHRPVPVSEALPVAGLGLAWRRKKEVTTQQGRRTLWVGEGDAALFRRAYDLARPVLRDAGFSWTSDERHEDGRVLYRPCCWEPVPADDAAAQRALDAAEAAVAADDARIGRAERMRVEMRHDAARRVAADSRAALDALRESLDTFYWAWPKKKETIARELLREPMEVDDVPKIVIADAARKLTRQVTEAVAKVRARVATDANGDWLERARDPEVRRAVHDAAQILSEMDADRASVRNGYGWGKSHSHVGHTLAGLRELSVIEASQALAAVWRHRKQVRADLRERCFGSAEA
jgi:hypothetical protein